MKNHSERYRKEISKLCTHKANLKEIISLYMHQEREELKSIDYAISMIDAEIEGYEKLIAMGV